MHPFLFSVKMLISKCIVTAVACIEQYQETDMCIISLYIVIWLQQGSCLRSTSRHTSSTWLPWLVDCLRTWNTNWISWWACVMYQSRLCRAVLFSLHVTSLSWVNPCTITGVTYIPVYGLTCIKKSSEVVVPSWLSCIGWCGLQTEVFHYTRRIVCFMTHVGLKKKSHLYLDTNESPWWWWH